MQLYTKGDMAKMFKLLVDTTKKLTDFHIQDKVVMLSYKDRDEFVMSTATSNITLTTNTMNSARCRLYKSLATEQERLLYCNTDSIVYVKLATAENLRLGNLLGEHNSKLVLNDYITTWVCCGSQNYSYVTKNGAQCCKVRGFTFKL